MPEEPEPHGNEDDEEILEEPVIAWAIIREDLDDEMMPSDGDPVAGESLKDGPAVDSRIYPMPITAPTTDAEGRTPFNEAGIDILENESIVTVIEDPTDGVEKCIPIPLGEGEELMEPIGFSYDRGTDPEWQEVAKVVRAQQE